MKLKDLETGPSVLRICGGKKVVRDRGEMEGFRTRVGGESGSVLYNGRKGEI